MASKKEFLEILSSQLVAITGGVIAGTLLAVFTDKLFIIPGLLIILPGYLELKGAIAGSLASRIGTELHTKRIRPNKKSVLIKENEQASLILILFVSMILGIATYMITFFLFGQNHPKLILVPMLASLVSSVFLFPITVKMAIWLYKHHHDPDNVMGPWIMSFGDIESIIALTAAVMIIL